MNEQLRLSDVKTGGQSTRRTDRAKIGKENENEKLLSKNENVIYLHYNNDFYRIVWEEIRWNQILTVGGELVGERTKRNFLKKLSLI